MIALPPSVTKREPSAADAADRGLGTELPEPALGVRQAERG